MIHDEGFKKCFKRRRMYQPHHYETDTQQPSQSCNSEKRTALYIITMVMPYFIGLGRE
jgi:hypothetical protein